MNFMGEDNQRSDIAADIVIVGAGIVGATIACMLGIGESTSGEHLEESTSGERTESGKKLCIKLIESNLSQRQYSGEQFDPRVVALSEESKKIFEFIGVWEDIEGQRLCPYHKMQVWDGEGTASINFDCRDIHVNELGYIVENSVITRALFAKVAELDNVELVAPCKVDGVVFGKAVDEPVSVLLSNGDNIRAPLLIAADGANSKLRDMAGIFTQEWPYEHTAIVTTVKTEKPHQYTAWQRFSPDGPLAYLPLLTDEQSENYCSIVWSLNDDVARQKMALPQEDFCRAVTAGLEERLGKVLCCDKRFSIPLIQRHALDYIRPGFALIGDAAHTIHPLAGQGVNLGLYDARALGAEIMRAVERQVPLHDESILKRYQRSRKIHNLGAMGAMEGFKRLFGSNSIWAQLVRNRGMDFVDQQAWLKKQFMQLARG